MSSHLNSIPIPHSSHSIPILHNSYVLFLTPTIHCYLASLTHSVAIPQLPQLLSLPSHEGVRGNLAPHSHAIKSTYTQFRGISRSFMQFCTQSEASRTYSLPLQSYATQIKPRYRDAKISAEMQNLQDFQYVHRESSGLDIEHLVP